MPTRLKNPAARERELRAGTSGELYRWQVSRTFSILMRTQESSFRRGTIQESCSYFMMVHHTQMATSTWVNSQHLAIDDEG